MTERQNTGLGLMEAVTDRLVAVLRSRLPGKLTQLEIDYDDDCELPAPTAVYGDSDYIPADINLEFPSILVTGESVSNNPGTEGMRDDTDGDMELSYSVFIFALLKGESEVDLKKKLYRYSLAIAEVLCATDAMPEYSCYLVNIDYQNPSVTTEDDFIRDVPMEFLITSNESF